MKAFTVFALACILAVSLKAQPSNPAYESYFACVRKAYVSYNQCLGNRGDFPKSEFPQVCTNGLNNLMKLCTKPPESAFYFGYVVVAILYAPPGNSSNAAFSDTSTSGSSSTFVNSQGQTASFGYTFSASNTGYKEGLTFASGSTSAGSEQFSTSLNAASGNQIKSTKDIIDHTQDTFYLWLNAAFTPEIDTEHDKIIMQISTGGGTYADVLPITVAQLQNPALIKAENLAPQVIRNPDGSTSTYPGLGGLRPSDFQSILALDPFLTGDPSAQPTNTLRYFDTLERPVLEGPAQAGEELNAATVSLAGSNSVTLSKSTTNTYTTGVSLTFGPFSYTNTQTLLTTTTNATTSGSGQQTSMTLGTSTVGCCNTSSTGQGGNCHLDIYEDLMFQTYVAIPEPYGCSGILPPGVGKPFAHPQAVQGQLMNANNQPEPNTPVTVKLPNGQALKVFTDSKGQFSVYEAPDGNATIQAGTATETISIKNGTSQPTTLHLH
jgi:hypothetical protein